MSHSYRSMDLVFFLPSVSEHDLKHPWQYTLVFGRLSAEVTLYYEGLNKGKICQCLQLRKVFFTVHQSFSKNKDRTQYPSQILDKVKTGKKTFQIVLMGWTETGLGASFITESTFQLVSTNFNSMCTNQRKSNMHSDCFQKKSLHIFLDLIFKLQFIQVVVSY